MNNPIKDLSKKEFALWICSLLIAAASNIFAKDIDPLSLAAACIGITSLVLAAKGSVWAQILMILFSILYGIISFRFKYWGEMITYLGMTLPMAIWSTVTWLKNPFGDGKTVAIKRINRTEILFLAFFSIAVTAVFYFILQALNTPNNAFSTNSVTTSFLAAALTMLRSSYYALAYAANDVVLIVLWIFAAAENPVYIPVVVNFSIFFINDIYGFISWKKRESALMTELKDIISSS